MLYIKPEVLAQNAAHGSFAAGCIPNFTQNCGFCERQK